MATNLRDEVQDLIDAWQEFLMQTPDWEAMTEGIIPKETGLGLVYEIPSPLERPNESFAIVDIRHKAFTEPHHHPKDEVEVFFVLEGTGTAVVGHREHQIEEGDIVVVFDGRAHYVIPHPSLVLAVISTPPPRPDHYLALQDSDPESGFDRKQFEILTLHVHD